MAHLGNPILGDALYGKPDYILRGKGLYLHAYSAVFNHPITSAELTINSELPKRFVKLFPELAATKP